jgi:hypothetical protein
MGCGSNSRRATIRIFERLSADESLFEAWSPLPPGSMVWSIAEDRPVAEVAEARWRGPGQPLEVCTRLGAVVRLGPSTELRVGGW